MPRRMDDDWKHLASSTMSWIERHSGCVERDCGMPVPLAFASFCKARGRYCTMDDFMHVLASDQYFPCKGDKPKVRWEYCYDSNLDESVVGGEYPWPCYIRAIQGHSGCDPDLMGRVEVTEDEVPFVFHQGYQDDAPPLLRMA